MRKKIPKEHLTLISLQTGGGCVHMVKKKQKKKGGEMRGGPDAFPKKKIFFFNLVVQKVALFVFNKGGWGGFSHFLCCVLRLLRVQPEGRNEDRIYFCGGAHTSYGPRLGSTSCS